MPEVAAKRVPYRGVQFNAPPEDTLGPIMKAINTAVQSLPSGVNGALVGTATGAGWNAAIVARVGHGWAVQAWIGSKWGDPIDVGGQVLKTW